MVKAAKNNISLALSRSRHLRANMTEAEKKLWRGLRKNQINEQKFRRQFPIGKYIVNFVCLEARLIIEVDGGQHQNQASYDLQRDTWLKHQHFIVLRFWNNEVLENIEGVMEKIMNVLEQPAPPSHWLQHNIRYANISLRRKKPLCGVLSSPARGEGEGNELAEAGNLRLHK